MTSAILADQMRVGVTLAASMPRTRFLDARNADLLAPHNFRVGAI